MLRRLLAFRRSRHFIPLLLVVCGFAILIYVASQYGEMYLGQKRLAQQWEEQQKRAITTTSASAAVDDSLMRLVIPKIDLSSFIVEGTTHRSLLLGPGHLVHTAEPGEPGNVVISGHRDTFFRHIHELEKGDQIYIDRGGKRLVYEVTGKKIVEPDDVAVTNPTKDSELTLITCYPTYYIGPAPKRLIVSAKLASEQEAKLTQTNAN